MKTMKFFIVIIDSFFSSDVTDQNKFVACTFLKVYIFFFSPDWVALDTYVYIHIHDNKKKRFCLLADAMCGTPVRCCSACKCVAGRGEKDNRIRPTLAQRRWRKARGILLKVTWLRWNDRQGESMKPKVSAQRSQTIWANDLHWISWLLGWCGSVCENGSLKVRRDLWEPQKQWWVKHRTKNIGNERKKKQNYVWCGLEYGQRLHVNKNQYSVHVIWPHEKCFIAFRKKIKFLCTQSAVQELF